MNNENHTFISGYHSGYLEIGKYNTVIGVKSANAVSIGDNCVLIGRDLNVSAPGKSNELAIRFSDGTVWRVEIPVPEGAHIDTGIRNHTTVVGVDAGNPTFAAS